MKSAQKLKEELNDNIHLTDLLDVLKGIAMAKYRILEKSREKFSERINTFEKFFHLIDFSSVQHPLVKGDGRLGIIIMTSDEGFMGGLNTRVINEALNYPDSLDAEIMVIGEWGARYLQGLGYKFVKFPGIMSENRNKEAVNLKDYVMKEGMAGTFSRLILVYPKPISFTVQTPKIVEILPCSSIFKRRQDYSVSYKDVIQEGPINHIIEYLVETWLLEKLMEVFEDSNLSEYSARAVHLETSHHLLQQKSKGIRLQYFRSHHEMVDKGIREVFSSRIIRKKKAYGKS